MSKSIKKADKSSKKLTDYFSRRDSSVTSSQPSSSQPSSSQPTPSQKNVLKPTQERRQPVKKGVSILSSDVEVISISSGNAPIYISSDTGPSHISISSDTSESAPAAVPAVTNCRPSKASKTSLASLRKSKEALTPVVPPTSTAKTTVKRRGQGAAANGQSTGLTKVTRRKRKADWSSESEEGPFMADPAKMNPALTTVPVFGAPQTNSTDKHARTAPSSPSTRSQRSSTSKRARITPRDPPHQPGQSGNEADVDELVPSSQSDEQELTIPKLLTKDPEAVKENVDKWRRETSVNLESSPPLSDYPLTSPTSPATTSGELVPAPDIVDNDGDVDMESSSGPMLLDVPPSDDKPVTSDPESEAEVRQQLAALAPSESPMQRQTSLPAPPRLPSPNSIHIGDADPSPFDDNPFLAPSPPPIESEPEPQRSPSPVALDPQTKAAQIIARIKAEAAQNADRSSSEEPELRELSESSSDESDGFFFNRRAKQPATPTKRGNSAAPSSPLTAMTSVSPPATQQPEAGPSRYSLRRRSSPTAKVPTPSPPRPTRKVANPLDKLLREKKTAVRRGQDIEGIRAAEAIVNGSASKKSLRDEMDEEEDSDAEARQADARSGPNGARRGSKGKSSNANGLEESESEDEADELDLKEATKHLGDKESEAVGKILDGDRKGWLLKGKGKALPERGVPLWRDDLDTGEGMDTDLPQLCIAPGDDPVLALLKSVAENQDASRLSRFLTPQLLSRVKREHTSQLCGWLLSLVLTVEETCASTAALSGLLGLAMRGTIADGLSTLVASALRHLGARPTVLEGCGLAVQEGDQLALNSRRQMSLASHIVAIVRAFAENKTLSVDQVPNLIIELLLIGMDPSTTDELACDIMVAIDILGATLPSTSSGFSDMEPLICQQVIALAKDFTPTNKAHLLTFFCGSCPQMSRVARWIAYCLILGKEFNPQSYTALPPLEPLITLASPTTGSQTTFDVVGNAEENNYFDNLNCYIEVLNVVLNDVPSYTLTEKRDYPAPDTPGAEKPKTGLQSLTRCLDVLHGKIVDTRAAHLDRSRVKAALQQLSFRVHYQREAALRSAGTGRPRTLHKYFAKPPTS